MFRRSLSDVFVERLCAAPFWANVVGNPLLQPEIREEAVTIYCRGNGLVRDLRLEDGGWVARTHPAFVPVVPVKGETLELRGNPSGGLTFAVQPDPLPPGLLSEETVRSYLTRLPSRPEDVLKDVIIQRRENMILDQEVAFADSRTERDRVDLCAYLAEPKAAVLVEIKRIDDDRLYEKNGAVEVIAQLTAYVRRLESHRDELLQAYRDVVRLKRSLGLGGRLGSVPEDGPGRFLPKPILVIGGCSAAVVEEIKAGLGPWAPLIQQLPTVAAALILCRTTCKLTMVRHSHVMNFD